MHLQQVTINSEKFPDKEYYPFKLDILNNTKNVEFKTNVTFLVGENGSGKTTLLKAIAKGAGIYIWQGIQRSRFEYNPYEEELYRYIHLKWNNGVVPGSFFSSQHFRNFSQIVDEWSSMDSGILDYFGGKSFMSQSHGQSIMSYFNSRYDKKGFYLLDEPETALSPKSQIEFLKLLSKINKSGHAQMIVASHSPILLACPDTVIYSFDSDTVKPIQYEDTEYYKTYRDFLNAPQSFI